MNNAQQLEVSAALGPFQPRAKHNLFHKDTALCLVKASHGIRRTLRRPASWTCELR
jgi:hypothetical protein